MSSKKASFLSLGAFLKCLLREGDGSVRFWFCFCFFGGEGSYSRILSNLFSFKILFY